MPSKEKSAVEAAADEAAGADEPIRVEFRGITFELRSNLNSDARFLLASRMSDHAAMYEALGPENAGRFLTLVRPGEQMPDVAREFFDALSAAAGWGNS